MAEQDDSTKRTPAQLLNDIHEGATAWALHGLTEIINRAKVDVKPRESE